MQVVLQSLCVTVYSNALTTLHNISCCAKMHETYIYIIIYVYTRKCYSIGQAKACSTQAILYCANSLSRLRLRVARFIFALHKKNITLGGYLDARRNI